MILLEEREEMPLNDALSKYSNEYEAIKSRAKKLTYLKDLISNKTKWKELAPTIAAQLLEQGIDEEENPLITYLSNFQGNNLNLSTLNLITQLQLNGFLKDEQLLKSIGEKNLYQDTLDNINFKLKVIAWIADGITGYEDNLELKDLRSKGKWKNASEMNSLLKSLRKITKLITLKDYLDYFKSKWNMSSDEVIDSLLKRLSEYDNEEGSIIMAILNAPDYSKEERNTFIKTLLDEKIPAKSFSKKKDDKVLNVAKYLSDQLYDKFAKEDRDTIDISKLQSSDNPGVKSF